MDDIHVTLVDIAHNIYSTSSLSQVKMRCRSEESSYAGGYEDGENY